MSGQNIKIYHVDAFATTLFRGNPAAVCVSGEALSKELMQNIAREMNLSETAFVSNGVNMGSFEIRWFTPKCEVDLCGHATMSAAKVLYEFYNVSQDWLSFDSKSGTLRTFKYGDEIMLDFPIDEVEADIICHTELLQTLGLKSYIRAAIGRKTRKLIIHIADAEQIPLLKPDFIKLAAGSFDTDVKGIGITARGIGKYDIISRYFNPWAGVNEDPVTGSVHTLLADYWSKILSKKSLLCYQASERGGEIRIKLAGNNRVELWGKAVIVTAGELFI
jgi:PhzF family phenazine biosynthesis protein